MVKKQKLTETHSDGTKWQIYPETHAEAVFGLDTCVASAIQKALQATELSSGTNMDNVTQTGTYVINGISCINVPPNWKINYATVYVSAINANSCTQILVDERNNRYTRARFGQSHTWTSWKKFTQD